MQYDWGVCQTVSEVCLKENPYMYTSISSAVERTTSWRRKQTQIDT